jgi:hypothetical protein
MRSAHDRVSYERSWSNFVDSIEQVWTSFNAEGKKTSPRFQAWVGEIKRLRSSDPLLKYLKFARDKSQHDPVSLQWSSGSVEIRGKHPERVMYFRDIKIYSDGTFDVEVSPDSGTEPDLLETTGKPSLPDISNRGSVAQAPQEHLGKRVGKMSPNIAAELGLRFYRGLLGQAKQKFLDSASTQK